MDDQLQNLTGHAGHDWKSTRTWQLADGRLDDVQTCRRCGARRRLLVGGEHQELLYSDPDPMPAACRLRRKHR